MNCEADILLFYNKSSADEGIAIALDEAEKQANFWNNGIEERSIKKAMLESLDNIDEVERIYNIVVAQGGI